MRVVLAYVFVGWLLIQIADVTLEPLHLPSWSETLVIWLVALGFPIAVILAWVLDVTPEGIAVTPPQDEPSVDDATIAVLPFVNMSGDPERVFQRWYVGGAPEPPGKTPAPQGLFTHICVCPQGHDTGHAINIQTTGCSLRTRRQRSPLWN